jgi:hypothetical protein
MSPKISPKHRQTACTAEAATAAHVRIDAGVTVTVIRLALFRIGQHLVGFFDFLEFSSASLLSGLRSGWYFIASLR